MIDDLAALRATVDVIAERDDLEGPLGGMLDDRVKCRRQQIKTAVKVCNCVCEAHAATPCAKRPFIPHEECNLPLRRNRFF